MSYVDTYGKDDKVQELYKKYGKRFTPPKMLIKMASNKETF